MPDNPDATNSRPGGPTWKVGLLGLVIVAVTLAAFSTVRGRSRNAAEAVARTQIKALGGMLFAGESGEHVGSLNLSLVRRQDNFDEAISLAKDLSWLKVLDLTGQSVSLEQLSQLKGLGLESLHVARTGIGDAAAPVIANMSSISALHASENHFTNEALESIGRLRQLVVLDLSATKIHGDLAPLGQLDQLSWLVLRGIPLDESAVATLSSMSGLKRLTITPEDMSHANYKLLKAQKPQIRVDGMDSDAPGAT